MSSRFTEEAPASVAELSGLIGAWLGRLGECWVDGEISELNRRANLCYITLRDMKEEASLVVAVAPSVLDKSPVAITVGSRVVFRAKVEWWKRGGDVRLRGLEVHAVGVGALLEQIEKLRQALLAEGLLDPSRKKPLPFLPGKVGLICGRDSDAKFDVVKNARRRWAAVQFDIREVAVQGPNCPAAVIGALKELEATADVDVIVITRGGGSVEDLLGFSDEALCRAVAACSKPVVSAIGHEQDRPVLDDVADFRASTPTDAARRIVPDVTEQLTVIAGLRARAAAVVVGVIEREQRGLDGVRSRPVLKQPMGLVDQHVQQLLAARRTALRIVVTAMKHADAQLESLTARMRSLSPANTLARGYAIAYLDDGSLIRDAATIASGTHLRVQVAQGEFAATAD